MILRRMSKHVKDQNWFAVTLDFFIVLLGILIAFQVTNWSESRQDRADEAIFLRDLHNDILLAFQQSARTEAIRFQQAKDLETGAELIFSEQPDRELTEAECTAIAYSHTNNVSRSRLPALIHLQSAGRMGIISDRVLTRELAELTQRQEVLDILIRDTRDTAGIAIANKYPDLFETKARWSRVSGKTGEIERDVESFCRLENLLTNRAFVNDITSNVDAYDAFMRDGLAPWLAQRQLVHNRVDVLLGISHEEEKAP